MAEIKLRIPDDMAIKLKNIAEDNSLTVNGFMKQVLDKTLSGQSLDTITPDLPDTLKVKVTPERKQEIMENASMLNLSISNYLNELICKKSTVDVEISVNDLQDFENEICTMVKMVNGIVTVLLRSDKVYEQDVQKILSLMSDINGKFNQIYQQELNDRKKLYEESRKRVFTEIDRNKLTRISSHGKKMNSSMNDMPNEEEGE